MSLKKIRRVLLFSSMLFLFKGIFPSPALSQNEILEQLIEDGKVGGFTTQLLCPGAIPCGFVRYSNIAINPTGDINKIVFTADAQVTMITSKGNLSNLNVRKCLFVANSLAGLVDPQDPNSGNTPFAIYMSKHDPINPGDGTGQFIEATKLDYRGMVEFHDPNSFFVNSRESSYAISKGN